MDDNLNENKELIEEELEENTASYMEECIKAFWNMMYYS